jgi:hypothetical protein
MKIANGNGYAYDDNSTAVALYQVCDVTTTFGTHSIIASFHPSSIMLQLSDGK